MKHDAAAFVQFCLRLYSHPGVTEVCLELQNQGGQNVNCLLLGAWAARAGYAIDAALWGDLRAHTAPVREGAVQPIRALRRQISKNSKLKEELRGPIKRMLLYAELRAEQAEEYDLHNRMAGLARRAEPGPDLLGRNLDALAPLGERGARFQALVIESGLLDQRS